MTSDEYDDPRKRDEWMQAQRENVLSYLGRERVPRRQSPVLEWFVAPYVSIWSVHTDHEVHRRVWVISGDLPTDYLTDEGVTNAREAVRSFGERWREVADCMRQGEEHPSIRIGDSTDQEHQNELGDLLRRRAGLLAEWAEDSDIW